MSLDASRQSLNARLTGPSAASLATDQDWNQLKPLVDDWWTDLKDWESTDTFDAAFADSRMTVRAMADDKKGKGSFPVPSKGQERGGETDRKITLAYGAAGMLARTKPENFYKAGQTQSLKNELGLHDLSASLLTPLRPWSAQLKHYEQATYVFMPLPKEEDLMVFYTLNGIAKAKDVSPAFRKYVRLIASQLTRVKYASAEDLHTTYVDLSDRTLKAARPSKLAQIQQFEALTPTFQFPGRFRYGVTGTAGAEGTEGAKTPVTEEEIKSRRDRAQRYKTILTSTVNAAVNEIVITYRSHGLQGRSRFPLFARLSADRTEFHVVSSANIRTKQTINANGQLVTK